MRTNEFILEILKTPVDVEDDPYLRVSINQEQGKNIFPGHTRVVYSSEMNGDSLRVLRMKSSKDHTIEYHIISLTHPPRYKRTPDEVNPRSLVHIMNFIYHDCQSYLERGNNIKLIASNKEQYLKYKKLAEMIIGRFKKDKIFDLYVDEIGEVPDNRGIMRPAIEIKHTIYPNKNMIPESFIY